MRLSGFLIVLITTAVLAQDRAIVQFRLKNDPGTKLRGWLVDVDDNGFVFERFGRTRRSTVRWDQLTDEDKKTLRRRFQLDGVEDEEFGIMDGHRLRFKGGVSVDGLLVRVDEEQQHWLQRDGLLLPYPGDRVRAVEKIRIDERDVYNEKQLYRIRLERKPPRSARAHRVLADYMFEVGNFEKAKVHYKEAIERDVRLREKLRPRLAEIDDIMRDAELAAELARIKRTARLDRNYEKAQQLVNEFIGRHPDAKRSAIKLGDEIEEARQEWLRKRFHIVKNEEFDRAVERYLIKSKPNIDEAMSWATSQLAKILRERIRERMGITKEELESFMGTKVKGSPHWASYWSGSFVLSKRAKRGKSSKKKIVGDPDKWWFIYADVNSRGNFIRAYAAERLPDLFEVIQVRTPPCSKCGGTGRIKHMSVHPLKALGGGASGAGHEWYQLCPRCFGARVDRVVGYK